MPHKLIVGIQGFAGALGSFFFYLAWFAVLSTQRLGERRDDIIRDSRLPVVLPLIPARDLQQGGESDGGKAQEEGRRANGSSTAVGRRGGARGDAGAGAGEADGGARRRACRGGGRAVEAGGEAGRGGRVGRKGRRRRRGGGGRVGRDAQRRARGRGRSRGRRRRARGGGGGDGRQGRDRDDGALALGQGLADGAAELLAGRVVGTVEAGVARDASIAGAALGLGGLVEAVDRVVAGRAHLEAGSASLGAAGSHGAKGLAGRVARVVTGVDGAEELADRHAHGHGHVARGLRRDGEGGRGSDRLEQHLDDVESVGCVVFVVVVVVWLVLLAERAWGWTTSTGMSAPGDLQKKKRKE